MPAIEEARGALSCLKYYTVYLSFYYCVQPPAYSMRPIAHWCRRMTSYGPLNPFLRAAHTHIYEQAMKTIFAVLLLKRYADN